jgi:hypothetical protein
MARKKCLKCGSTKIIKRGSKIIKPATSARNAIAGFQILTIHG